MSEDTSDFKSRVTLNVNPANLVNEALALIEEDIQDAGEQTVNDNESSEDDNNKSFAST